MQFTQTLQPHTMEIVLNSSLPYKNIHQLQSGRIKKYREAMALLTIHDFDTILKQEISSPTNNQYFNLQHIFLKCHDYLGEAQDLDTSAESADV